MTNNNQKDIKKLIKQEQEFLDEFSKIDTSENIVKTLWKPVIIAQSLLFLTELKNYESKR